MPNRTRRVRHLTLVPDVPTEAELPSRRARRSVSTSTSGIVQLILRIDLDGVAPRVWRRVEVRSDLLLPELHAVLQSAMGWSDVLGYTFSRTADGATLTYGAQSDHGSAEVRLPADHVRIDSILSTAGDRMEYEYGGEWVHRIEMESVNTDIDDLRPLCMDGAGVCPPDLPSGSVEPSFDLLNVNARLRSARSIRSTEVESTAASPLIARLFRHARSAPVSRLLELLPRCELTIDSSVDLPVARVAMSKVSWFLDRVGDRGMRLTDAGLLPPTVVDAIRDELDWGIGWHGSSSHEGDHHQATDLKEALKRLGLVRVLRGSLVRTRAGTTLQGDHVGLWHHCAARLPLGRQHHEQDAGTLFLVALAASASAQQRDEMVVETMHALGWGVAEHDPFEAQKAAHSTVAFLDLIGAHGPLYYLRRTGSDSPSWSRRFARDALRSSP